MSICLLQNRSYKLAMTPLVTLSVHNCAQWTTQTLMSEAASGDLVFTKFGVFIYCTYLIILGTSACFSLL